MCWTVRSNVRNALKQPHWVPLISGLATGYWESKEDVLEKLAGRAELHAAHGGSAKDEVSPRGWKKSCALCQRLGKGRSLSVILGNGEVGPAAGKFRKRGVRQE